MEKKVYKYYVMSLSVIFMVIAMCILVNGMIHKAKANDIEIVYMDDESLKRVEEQLPSYVIDEINKSDYELAEVYDLLFDEMGKEFGISDEYFVRGENDKKNLYEQLKEAWKDPANREKIEEALGKIEDITMIPEEVIDEIASCILGKRPEETESPEPESTEEA